LPLFSRLLKALGLRDMLRTYESFYYRLHTMGFYEYLAPTEDIIHTVEVEVPSLIGRMKEIIRNICGADISDVLRSYDEALKLKREIIAKDTQLARIYDSINDLLERKLEPIKHTLLRGKTKRNPA